MIHILTGALVWRHQTRIAPSSDPAASNVLLQLTAKSAIPAEAPRNVANNRPVETLHFLTKWSSAPYGNIELKNYTYFSTLSFSPTNRENILASQIEQDAIGVRDVTKSAAKELDAAIELGWHSTAFINRTRQLSTQ